MSYELKVNEMKSIQHLCLTSTPRTLPTPPQELFHCFLYQFFSDGFLAKKVYKGQIVKAFEWKQGATDIKIKD